MARSVRIARSTRIFKKGFRKKHPDDQQHVRDALRQMETDLEHASLRAKPMQGVRGVWEAHASSSAVMTFQFDTSTDVTMRACCNHDIYRRP